MFGFLSLVFMILLVTCVEMTIVIVYFQLCDEVISVVNMDMDACKVHIDIQRKADNFCIFSYCSIST